MTDKNSNKQNTIQENQQDLTPEEKKVKDLMEQAKRIRQQLSTADIILEDEKPLVSKKTIIYISLLILSLAVLVFLFANTSTKQKMQERVSKIARAISSPESTTKNVTPENEHKQAKPKEEIYGPFNATEDIKRAKSTLSSPPVIKREKVTSPIGRTKPKKRIITKANKKKRNIKKVQITLTPEKEAYSFLLAEKKAFAGLVNGDSDQYHFQNYSVRKKGEDIFLLDFLFMKGTPGHAVHFFWEVNMSTHTIRPIGLETVRFDRMHIQ